MRRRTQQFYRENGNRRKMALQRSDKSISALCFIANISNSFILIYYCVSLSKIKSDLTAIFSFILSLLNQKFILIFSLLFSLNPSFLLIFCFLSKKTLCMLVTIYVQYMRLYYIRLYISNRVNRLYYISISVTGESSQITDITDG